MKVLTDISEKLIQIHTVKTIKGFQDALDFQSMIYIFKNKGNDKGILEDIYEYVEHPLTHRCFETFILSSGKLNERRIICKKVEKWTLKSNNFFQEGSSWESAVRWLLDDGFIIKKICLCSIPEINKSCDLSLFKIQQISHQEKVKDLLEQKQDSVFVERKTYWTCENCSFPNYSISKCEFCQLEVKRK
jgi:rubrerythrin